jgi:peptidyl-tRNA hydrolase
MKLMNYDLIKKENFHKRLANGGPVALRIAVLNKKLRNLIHEFVRKNINEKENEKVDKVLDQCIRDNREVILELQSKFKEWRGQEHTWINVILMD